ncbi:GNAT family N-acetyltransferase [Bacillus marinisedimentorum]|uniref:GNAT family N-acetyltransferase n=1 Tax=Bacillus marinisedimentorum TaxID=1821260 RepID=UPI0012FF79F4|nr:GNAT family N-acetyltransferase [Bacillus marinisedimentorum]
MEFREITTKDEFRRAFHIMSQLRPHLNMEEYLRMLEKMVSDGYRMFGLYDSDELRALAGTIILTNFYYGKHLWIYDLVTDKEYRSAGYGEELLDHLEKFALSNNCEIIALSSGLKREAAHRFYDQKAGFNRVSYVFKKEMM